MDMLNLDWQTVFTPTTPLVEIVLHGTLVYLFLFIVLRSMRICAAFHLNIRLRTYGGWFVPRIQGDTSELPNIYSSAI